MIEVTFTNSKNEEIPKKLIIDIEFIKKNFDFFEDFLIDCFHENLNPCVCSLNESQSQCDCSGKYGDEISIKEVKNV